MVSLTQTAAAQILRMMGEQRLNPREVGVRLGVKPSGCSGLSYTIEFDRSAREGDRVSEQHGVRLYLDADSAPYLEGTEVDWKGGLLGSGFQFRNPQATRTCGCGESFTI